MASFGEPKSPPTPTTGTTDLRSDTPENLSDNDCASQNMAPDDSSGQNLMDENLSDTDADVTTIRRLVLFCFVSLPIYDPHAYAFVF